jgi:hypothetical protein
MSWAFFIRVSIKTNCANVRQRSGFFWANFAMVIHKFITNKLTAVSEKQKHCSIHQDSWGNNKSGCHRMSVCAVAVFKRLFFEIQHPIS